MTNNKYLALYIPRDYRFIREKVLGEDRTIVGMDVLTELFVTYLMQGHAELNIANLAADLDEQYDRLMTTGDVLAALETSPLRKLYDSIEVVDEVFLDSGDTFFAIEQSDDTMRDKKLILRALLLSFWVYVRDDVFIDDFPSHQSNRQLIWTNFLDEDLFEDFVRCFDLNWLVKQIDNSCWITFESNVVDLKAQANKLDSGDDNAEA